MTPADDASLLTLTGTVALNDRLFTNFFDVAGRTATATSAEGRVTSSTLNAQGALASISVPN
ncbi:MAG: hypothetical protein ACREMY_17425, partial [bacterium]